MTPYVVTDIGRRTIFYNVLLYLYMFDRCDYWHHQAFVKIKILKSDMSVPYIYSLY